MLKQILAGVAIGAVGIGAGFAGGAVYKDKTIDVTQRDEYKQVVNDNNDLNTKLDATKLALANLTTQRDSLEATKKQLETQLAAAQKQLSDKTAELETKQSELETADEQIRVLNARIATLETDAEANAAQITALQGQVTTLIDTKTSLEADIADLNGQIQALNADIEDNASEIENLTTALNAKTAELQALQAKLQQVTANINGATITYERQRKSFWFPTFSDNVYQGVRTVGFDEYSRDSLKNFCESDGIQSLLNSNESIKYGDEYLCKYWYEVEDVYNWCMGRTGGTMSEQIGRYDFDAAAISSITTYVIYNSQQYLLADFVNTYGQSTDDNLYDFTFDFDYELNDVGAISSFTININVTPCEQ